MGRKKISEEAREKIRELRREGYTYQEIADEINVSKATAYQHGRSVEVPLDVKKGGYVSGKDTYPSIMYKSGKIEIKAPKTIEAIRELEEIIDFWKERIKEE